MSDRSYPPALDLLEQIPDPETVKGWLAEAIRRTALLRSLLRVSIRKADYKRKDVDAKEVKPCPR